MSSRWALLLACVWIPSGSACISQHEYDAALAESDRLRGELTAAAATAAQSDKSHQTLMAETNEALTRAETQLRDTTTQLDQAQASGSEMQAKLDDMIALNDQLKKELERLGKDVDKLLSNNVQLSASLVSTKARLALLRRNQEAADRRAQLFKDLALKLHKMVDSGNLRVVLRDGRMVLQLPNHVLFDSASVSVKSDGKQAIEAVAGVLAKLDKRQFQVSGHTDNVPIFSKRFTSNWELSAGRAIAIVNLLMQHDIDARRVSAAAYAEFDPVADNATEEGKALNRRIEITLVPSIDEMVQLPGESTAGT